MRTRYQGVWNIVRFNWQFYVISIGAMLLMADFYLVGLYGVFPVIIAASIFITTITSLAVSHYIYDRTGLYDLTWLDPLTFTAAPLIVNINAGFDETSALLLQRYPAASLRVLDFYDKVKHTEVSIERARKAYPPYPGTEKITTTESLLKANSSDVVFGIFALHEIRDSDERIVFLKQIKESLKSGGRCIIVEHLRDVPNFLAYNIGFLHFLPLKEWTKCFSQAGLEIETHSKITPFVNVLVLRSI